MDAGGTAPISRSRAMPPATPAAQATTSTPNRSKRRRTPLVAPLTANTKVAPRSIASKSMGEDYTDCRRRPRWQSAGQGEGMPRRYFHHWRTADRVARFVVGRRRLLLSVAAGLVLFALLPNHMRLPTRFILAWDLTALLYVTAPLGMIYYPTVETCHDRAS